MAGDVLEVNDSMLRVRDEVATCSEPRVKATTCFEA
jgi:hypothetical protein